MPGYTPWWGLLEVVLPINAKPQEGRVLHTHCRLLHGQAHRELRGSFFDRRLGVYTDGKDGAV